VGPAASDATPGGSGGAGVAPSPQILETRCVAAKGRRCIDSHWVEPGATIVVRGRFLKNVNAILFYGHPGRGDDVSAAARPHGATQVTTNVPPKALNGPLAAVTAAGVRSKKWNGLVIDEPGQAPPLPKQNGAQPAIGTGVPAPRKIFYGGLRKAAFAYRVASSGAVDVSVNLVRVADGAVVRRWQNPQVAPGATQRVVWDGTAGGKVQPEGYYAFQATVPSASGSVSTRTSAEKDSFAFYDHMFPVRGKHDYGSSGARFGSGRSGHSHQGQDVFASCGTPLLAARAGKVTYRGYHAAAGYYLVIAGSGTAQDYVYMHLREAAVVKQGERVYTGQQIGAVGESGNAHGCHLHFELWSAPGWYKGGRPFDPLPELQRWDRAS
jgi:murein DD-endopeptidase MepM/ murein hydrolase activator NlpD